MKRKWIALFAAAALALPLAAGCAGNGTGDMEAYRGRFEAAAVSRQLDSAEGITSGRRYPGIRRLSGGRERAGYLGRAESICGK